MNRRAHLHAAIALFAIACGDGGVVRTTSSVVVDSEVSFGHAWVGDTAQATLVVASTGTGFVEIRTLVPGPGITLLDDTPAGRRLGPGVRRKLLLGWTPTEPGTIDTTVILTTDVPGDPEHHVRVTGEARAIPSCDDGNQCTDDAFDKARERCDHTTHERACDDGSACTIDDRCDDGACRGIARDCDDDNVCTLNACDPLVGCIHPPDGRQCDDGDPCTTDLCDPDDGCAHPDAPDGTSCGAFSCSTVHACVFGTCRELDVTGSSDGFPCEDGDLCTVGDECLAGECSGGPRRHGGPEIVASFGTFGGENAYVATDGYRYLFVDRGEATSEVQTLRIAVIEEGALRARGTLPLAVQAQPIVIAAGHFATARDGYLVLVDATDPDQPTMEILPLPLQPAPIVKLMRVAGGILVLRVDPMSQRRELVFVPLDGTPPQPGTPLQLLDFGERTDVDVSGSTVFAAGPQFSFLYDLDALGNITPWGKSEAIPNGEHVSVSGDLIAAHQGGFIRVARREGASDIPVRCSAESGGPCRLLGPACSALFEPGNVRTCENDAPCPDDTHCVTMEVELCPQCEDTFCEDGCCGTAMPVCATRGQAERFLGQIRVDGTLRALVLSGDNLFWSTEKGIFAARIMSPTAPGVGAIQRVHQLDPLPATSLAYGAEHLLASGSLALPLRLVRDPGGDTVGLRITGPGHGEVTAVVDGALARVRVVGPHASGEIDLVTKEIARWTITSTAPSDGRPRVTVGDARGASLSGPELFASPPRDECIGAVVEHVDGRGNVGEWPICGFGDGPFAVAPGVVWAAPHAAYPIPPNTPQPPPQVMRAWSVAPNFDPMPVSEWLVPEHVQVRALRASDDGRVFAMLSFVGISSSSTTPPTMQLQLYDSSDADPIGTADLGSDLSSQPREDRSFLAYGRTAISMRDGTVRLHRMLPASGDPPEDRPLLALTSWSPGWPEQIASMSATRAWIGHYAHGFSSGPSRFGPVLAEVLYDAAGSTLEYGGTVALPTMLVDAYDVGPYTVAATRSSVVVVAPSCR